ncbi:membrane protein FAM174B isoform X2 [Phyllostomus discolor]|uniref:Membrane protein FAM174B isoform X2 n=2 Tax=Phyllostomus discolor TaxID=89673 RepID=A0A7E6CQ78_9CHIR|nr:membrane protein FAM174B isoform X2 [Phyllostomus discolor]
MTRCNVCVAAARALPGAAVSCQAPRSRLGRRSPGHRPLRGCWTRAQPRTLLGPTPPARTMRAAPLLLLLPPLLLLLLALLAVPAAHASRVQSAAAPQPEHPPPGSGPVNTTRTRSGEAAVAGGGSSNSSGDALVTRISSLLRDLPTLKAAVIVACAFTAFLIACLLLRVFRSGKRLKKTRKYDIITTPAERVEMAPLNEEEDEDEDSTVFDIKYR